MTTVEHPILAQLRAALPGMRLVTEPAEVEPYRRDETEFLPAGQPLAAAFPTTSAQVSTIVRLAAAARVPLVVRGGGTGLSGGANAVEGGLVIVMTGMDRILEIDADDLLVVTQAGVITAELERAVEARGLFYPPDPASHETSSIGGNLAENAGGLRCVKYGVTRDYVLGLEVVLADGELIRTGGRNVKDVMGYDLTRLFVGSEGTLGIITEATLRLRPVPAPKVTLLAFFRHVRHALVSTRPRVPCCSSNRTPVAGSPRPSWRPPRPPVPPPAPPLSSVPPIRRRRMPCAKPGAGPTGPWHRRAQPGPRTSACLAAGLPS